MLYVPSIEECVDFAKKIGSKHIIEVKIEPKEWSIAFNCHKNCELNPILGYYFVKDSHNILHAFKHSILDDGDFIDITPTLDNRKYNVFAFPSKYDDEVLTYNEGSVYINKNKKGNELMFYVYALIDPRNNKPFYIGKGKDDRCLSHFKKHQLEKENNSKKRAKIKKIKKMGLDPVIEFYAQNIEDEKLAYTIEEFYIKKYGRIGFEENGILTNICLGSRPPNHKGKTYIEIYGKNKAEEIIEKKRNLQLKAGGYGPKKHTEKTKQKMSLRTKGKNNPRFGVIVKGTEVAEKISKAHKGKKHYYRSKLYVIENTELSIKDFIFSNDLEKYCKKNNLSKATFDAQLGYNWPVSRKGKNKGYKMRLATEVELSSYIIGGVKNDVSEDTFKGFSL